MRRGRIAFQTQRKQAGSAGPRRGEGGGSRSGVLAAAVQWWNWKLYKERGCEVRTEVEGTTGEGREEKVGRHSISPLFEP